MILGNSFNFFYFFILYLERVTNYLATQPDIRQPLSDTTLSKLECLQGPRSKLYSQRSGGQCSVCIYKLIIDRPYARLQAQQMISRTSAVLTNRMKTQDKQIDLCKMIGGGIVNVVV